MITRKVRALVNVHFAIFSGVPRPACTRVLNAIGGAVATMLARRYYLSRAEAKVAYLLPLAIGVEVA